MTKEESRKVKIVNSLIAQFILSDAEFLIQTKFGDLEEKEKAEDARIRAKDMKEFVQDMNEVFTVDSTKVQEIGCELIAELVTTMNSTLSDLVKALDDNQITEPKSTRKRKAADGDKPRVNSKVNHKKKAK